MQFASELEILLHQTSDKLFDVIYGGPRRPAKYPLICIKNELTSAYPNIQIANGEIITEIDMIIYS